MGEGEGWRDDYVQWWFDFLNEKGGKGISRDTWIMVSHISGGPVSCGLTMHSLFISAQFTEFVRTIDFKFEQYDIEGGGSVIYFNH